MPKYSGNIAKMLVQHTDPVTYTLPIGSSKLELNSLLGQQLTLKYSGTINCIYCNRITNKSFNQGYCYPCFRSLARCDSCIIHPQNCHYHLGTCREPEWGNNHCMQEHYIYLANTSSLKIGITRHTQIPTRWIDQGATQALPLFKVKSRLASGMIEVAFAKLIADKTNWRKMLSAAIPTIDLVAQKHTLLEQLQPELDELWNSRPDLSAEALPDSQIYNFNYPVLEYPAKISSINLEKTPEFTATLLGIKGQYLIFDIGVVNMRKYGGYQLNVNV